MAAPLIRVDAPSTTVQPTPGTTPVDLQAETVLAGQQGKSAEALQGVAGQVQQFSAQIMRDETLKQAQIDADKSVIYNEKGEPVHDRDARGIGGIVYNQTFNQAAFATYRVQALADLNRKADLALAKNPNNPAAVLAELTPYVDETLKNMPVTFADQMKPAFSGVLNAARTSSLAGKARNDLAGIANSLGDERTAIVVDTGNIIASQATTGTMDDALPAGSPNRIEFDRRMEEHAKRQRASGASEEAIKRGYDETFAHARAHAMGLFWGKEIVNASNVSEEAGAKATANARQAVDEFSAQKENTPYWGKLRDIADGYIQRAQTTAQVKNAALQHNTNTVVANRTLEARAIEQAITNQQISPDQAWRAHEALENAKAADMMGRRPTHQLQIMMAGSGIIPSILNQNVSQQQAWQAQQDTQVQTRYQAVAGNVASMYVNGNEAERREAIVQAKDLLGDTNVTEKARTNPAYAQLRSAMSGVLAESAASAKAYDWAEARELIRSGKIDKADHARVFAEWEANGHIGKYGISRDQAVALMAEGARNNDAVKVASQLAVNAQKSANSGVVVGRAQQEVLEAQANGKVPGALGNGATPVNTQVDDAGRTTVVTPALTKESVQFALEKQKSLGFLPKGWAPLIGELGDNVDQPTQTAAANLVRGFEANERNRIRQHYGDDTRALEMAVYSASTSVFGAANVKKAYQYENGGYKATPEQIQEAVKPYMQPSERQMNAQQADYETVFQQIIGKVSNAGSIDARNNPNNSWYNRIWRWNLSGLGLGLSTNDELMKHEPYRLYEERQIYGDMLPEGANEGNMRYSALVMKHKTNFIAGKYLPENRLGDLQQNFDPVKLGDRQWTKDNKHNLSWVESTDATSGEKLYTLTFKGFENEMQKAHPVLAGATHTQINGMVEGRMKSAYPMLYRDTVPGSIRVSSEETPTGTMAYKVTGKSISGAGPIDYTFINPADPQWKPGLEQLSERIARVMKDGEAASNALMKWWKYDIFKADEMQAVKAKLMDDVAKNKDAGETWVNLWHGVKQVVGAVRGESVKDLDAIGKIEVGRYLGNASGWSYALGANSGLSVPHNIFDLSRPSSALPAQPGSHLNVDTLVQPDEFAWPDPKQYATLVNRRNQELTQRLRQPATAMPVGAPQGQSPPSATGFDYSVTSSSRGTTQEGRIEASTQFNPEGPGYDLDTAKAAGMRPQESEGPNKGHMGSVAEVSEADRRKYKLPDEAYIMLKGRGHKSWKLGVQGEVERGFKVVKLGNRYYSVPEDWKRP